MQFLNFLLLSPKMDIENDEYFVKAVKEGYRARSAYKLLQLARCFDLFKDVKRVIDLCAAPGSWSQVISNQLHGLTNFTIPQNIKLDVNVTIVAIDLSSMNNVPGVIQLKGDITKSSTCEKITNVFEGHKVELIVCDGAHDVSGMEMVDFHLHLELIKACVHIILQTLKDNGSFIAKVFNTLGCHIFVRQLRIFFKDVHIVKPHSSRAESYECFAVCKGYNRPINFDPLVLTPYLENSYCSFTNLKGIHKLLVPFLVTGSYCIQEDEFVQLYEEYGDCIFERNDFAEDIYEDAHKVMSNIYNENIEVNDAHDQTEEVLKICSKSYKSNIGLTRKPFILYLDKHDKIKLFEDILQKDKHLKKIPQEMKVANKQSPEKEKFQCPRNTYLQAMSDKQHQQEKKADQKDNPHEQIVEEIRDCEIDRLKIDATLLPELFSRNLTLSKTNVEEEFPSHPWFPSAIGEDDRKLIKSLKYEETCQKSAVNANNFDQNLECLKLVNMRREGLEQLRIMFQNKSNKDDPS